MGITDRVVNNILGNKISKDKNKKDFQEGSWVNDLNSTEKNKYDILKKIGMQYNLKGAKLSSYIADRFYGMNHEEALNNTKFVR
jgi:hypothetical protein